MEIKGKEGMIRNIMKERQRERLLGRHIKDKRVQNIKNFLHTHITIHNIQLLKLTNLKKIIKIGH